MKADKGKKDKSVEKGKSVEKKGGKGKEIESESKENKVRVASGYILFGKDERQKVIKDNPEMKAKEIMAELGKRWNAADAKTKEKYNKMSDNLKTEAVAAEKGKDKKKEVSKPKAVAKDVKKDKKGKSKGDESD